VFGFRAAIEFGGPAGTRSGALRESAVTDFEQASLGQSVQVKRGEGALQANCFGSFVSADLTPARDDVLVQRTTRWILQESDGLEIGHTLVGIDSKIKRGRLRAPTQHWRSW